MMENSSWIGQSKRELDTPALLIHTEALEQNLATMQRLAEQAGVSYLPHTKTHKSPLISHRQIAAGAAGICCAKLSEAEVMAAGGVGDILLTTEIAGARKIARLMVLAQQCRLTIVVDDAANAAMLADAAHAQGIRLGVLVDVDVGQGRCGVRPGPAAVALAKQVERSGSLEFRGLQGYHGGLQMIVEFQQRQAGSRTALRLLAETAEQVRKEGIACDILSGGGTGTALIDSEIGVLTELQPGSYVFMDSRYGAIQWTAEGGPPPFVPALTVLGTVISRPSADRAIVDIGMKAASCDQGPIAPLDMFGARFEFAGDEHGILRFERPGCPLAVGDLVEFSPSHCDTTVNLYDRFFVLRGDVVEAVWPVAAR